MRSEPRRNLLTHFDRRVHFGQSVPSTTEEAGQGPVPPKSDEPISLIYAPIGDAAHGILEEGVGDWAEQCVGRFLAI